MAIPTPLPDPSLRGGRFARTSGRFHRNPQIGIDVHKKKHAAVVMTQDFTTHSKFKFNNSKEGFEMALERARIEMVRTGSRGAIFAIETGGHYWRNLATSNIAPGRRYFAWRRKYRKEIKLCG